MPEPESPESGGAPSGAPTSPVTLLLRRWRSGDAQAFDEMLPLVYEELHRLASRSLSGEPQGHTLQTTALVNEAYLRLAGASVDWEDRKHFLAVAARTMRRILVDHARSRGSAKRGGGMSAVDLDQVALAAAERPDDLLALDEALERLFALDERKGRAIELHYFAGLNYDEASQALGISPATTHRELRLAKAWLFKELQDDRPIP